MSEVQEFLSRAAAGPFKLTLRELLATWGFRARTYESVARIQRDLSAAGLRCEPDLADGDVDSVVRVSVVTAPSSTDEVPASDVAADVEEQDEPLQLPPVALLVRHIPSATHGVVGVRPDQSLGEAQAVMSAHDYSQLAVISGDRDLKGAVSWRSIAQARLAKSEITLTDATMRPAPEVRAYEELLGQIELIYRTDFVFVRDEDYRVCGVVTTADLTTPFFQLGEIERRLRRCIDRVFSADELRAVTRRSRLKSATDMTFGQYIQLLNDEARWQRLGSGFPCGLFIGYLDAARVVRNKVMHFGEELKPADKEKLKLCLNCMRVLDPLP
jgi:CBS domain-containing protein